MERFDIAIIGTGPAGLSAAVTAKIRNKNIILFGNRELSTKVSKAHTVLNYLGMPSVSGKEMQEVFNKQIDELGINITEDKISAVYNLGEYFALQGMTEIYEATTVILATGMNMTKTFLGEEEYLGRGVSYCATCDAALYKGRTAIVIGYSESEEREALFLAEIADKVMYLPMYKTEMKETEKVCIIYDKPKEIKGDDASGKMTLVADKGNYEADGIFVLRDSVSLSQLVPGIKMDGQHVAVDRNMKTEIPGCFACGDIVGLPYQYIKSAGEGNVAALSAVAYLAENKMKMSDHLTIYGGN